ncbi:MAG: symmetrical bis(5'-nucleosyl)-tetraphosphatase [Thermoanaerobaculia bacterium]
MRFPGRSPNISSVATYAIGDVQGCFTTFQRLLERIRFRDGRDRIWLTGDLVNRGPRSLEMLRWARAAGPAVTTVLGNHDLHLLSRAEGIEPAKPGDTLDEILSARDRGPLLEWLRSRPLLHREGKHVLVHAGLLPQWRIDDAAALAAGIEAELRGAFHQRFLERLKLVKNGSWESRMSAARRRALAASILTRIRTCASDGRLCGRFSGPPEDAPAGCRPWFTRRRRRRREPAIVFGHWSALGLKLTPGLIGLDTGCVWGGTLTAIRLEDRKTFSEPMAD